MFFLRSFHFLLETLEIFLSKQEIEVGRVASVASSLLSAGADPSSQIFNKAGRFVQLKQLQDGGWSDVEETIWCVYLLKRLGNYDHSVKKAYTWLLNSKSFNGGWGRSSRDFPRIPLTSWIAILFPDLLGVSDIEWLIDKVEEEISMDFFLSYKVSLPLFALKNIEKVPHEYESKWSELLASQQNDDGGFSPWKSHPVGSEIVSTSYAFLALSHYARFESINERCLKWVFNNQLLDGSWPYHYMDHGACLGMLALSTAMKEGKIGV